MSIGTLARWQDALVAKAACEEALDFAQGFDSFQAAWDACERGDWMLWWIERHLTAGPMSPERRPLVRVACACARLVLPYVKAGELRPLQAIELAERWANGDDTVTREQIRAAAYAAYAAAADAYDAAYAAYAASAADAYDAAYAAYAAAYAADAYDAAYTPAARRKAWKECADLVRRDYPHPPMVAR